MFYAKLRPRGFSNEFEIQAFATRQLRDQFVAAVPRTRWSGHYNAWVEQEPSARAYACAAAEARKALHHELTREDAYDAAGNYVRRTARYDVPGYQVFRTPLTLAEYFGSSVITALDRDGYPVSAEEMAAA